MIYNHKPHTRAYPFVFGVFLVSIMFMLIWMCTWSHRIMHICINCGEKLRLIYRSISHLVITLVLYRGRFDLFIWITRYHICHIQKLPWQLNNATCDWIDSFSWSYININRKNCSSFDHIKVFALVIWGKNYLRLTTSLILFNSVREVDSRNKMRVQMLVE